MVWVGVSPMVTMPIIHRGIARIIFAITGTPIERIARVMPVVAGIIVMTGMTLVTELPGKIMKTGVTVMAQMMRMRAQILSVNAKLQEIAWGRSDTTVHCYRPDNPAPRIR